MEMTHGACQFLWLKVHLIKVSLLTSLSVAVKILLYIPSIASLSCSIQDQDNVTSLLLNRSLVVDVKGKVCESKDENLTKII